MEFCALSEAKGMDMKMSKRFEAKICWLSEAQGGRKELPFGDKYAPIIQITKPLFESIEFWSVFVINKKVLCENETLAHMEYLSDAASDNLFPGVEFKLYEGPKVVASGVVLREIVC